MAYPSVTFTLTNYTTADAGMVNQNFTDLISGMSDGSKDFSIATLTVASTLTFSGLTSSQAVFTNGAKQLVSNAITGSGNVVMSASPTLTGTMAAASGSFSGTLLVTGVSTLNGNVNIGTTVTPAGNLHIASDGTASAYLSRASTDASSGFLSFRKARGTHASSSNVSDGDNIGAISADAYSGGAYYSTGAITFSVDGAVTNGQRPPSRIELRTNISNGPQTERVRIHGSGNVSIGSTTDNGYNLEVSGTTKIGGSLIAAAATFSSAATFNGGITSVTASTSGWFDYGTFTGTATGIVGSPTATFYYVRVGNLVTISTSGLTGTSNSTSFTITTSGFPLGLIPSNPIVTTPVASMFDNGSSYTGFFTMGSGGTTFNARFRNSLSGYTGTFTSSGTKGMDVGTFSYLTS